MLPVEVAQKMGVADSEAVPESVTLDEYEAVLVAVEHLVTVSVPEVLPPGIVAVTLRVG